MPTPLDAAVAATLRSPERLGEIELIEIALDGAVWRFAPAPVDGAAPVFGGETYTPIGFETEGWEARATGALPQPRIRVGLARPDGDTGPAAQLLAVIEANHDLVGAVLTRLRTFRRHLDDGTEPNGAAWFGRETWIVEAKSQHTPELVEFTLRSPADQGDLQLPRGQNLPRCRFVYRRWNGTGFSYLSDRRQCPYAGAALFDVQDQPVAAGADDRCSKLLSGCRARFGAAAPLPFGGNPAAGRVRLS